MEERYDLNWLKQLGSTGFAGHIYNNGLEKRKEMLHGLEEELAGKKEMTEEDRLELIKACGFLCNYLYESDPKKTIQHKERALEYLNEYLESDNPEITRQDRSVNSIRKADVLRRLGKSKEAKELLDSMNMTEIKADPEVGFEYWHQKTLLTSDIDQQTKFTANARESFSMISPETVQKNIFTAEKKVQIDTWGFMFEMREGFIQKWQGKSQEAEKHFSNCEKIFRECPAQGEARFPRAVGDVYLNGALFFAYVRADRQKADECLQKSTKTKEGYIVNDFRDMVEARFNIEKDIKGSNIEPKTFFNSARYDEEKDTLKFIPIEQTDEKMRACGRKFGNNQVTLKRKISELINVEEVNITARNADRLPREKAAAVKYLAGISKELTIDRPSGAQHGE